MSLYANIFSTWDDGDRQMIRENPGGLQQANIKKYDFGRSSLNLFPYSSSRSMRSKSVLGRPKPTAS